MGRQDLTRKWLNTYLIVLYDDLSKSASDHFTTSFPLILIKQCSDNILLYGMQHIEDKYSVVKFYFVLRVLDDMTVYVFINEDRLPDSAFSWALSHSKGKL